MAFSPLDMSYFSRRIQLERVFGSSLRFESAEFGEERPTMPEAIKAVEEAIDQYVTQKKEELRLKELKEPF